MVKIIPRRTTFFLVAFLYIAFSCKNRHPFPESKPPFNLAVERPSFKDQTYNILDFGAKPDSVFDNSDVFRFAIDSCHRNGGGKIVIPKGKYFTGAIHLKSNVHLFFEDGAKLFFSDNPSHYLPAVFTRWEGMECYNYSPLIYANSCENIGISGNGELHGNGSSWWFMKKEQGKSLHKLYEMVLNHTKPQERIMATNDSLSYLRPSFIQFVNCRNILLENFTIMDGPMWTIHLVYSTNITASKLKVITNGVNTDGIIPDSSSDVLISECYFSTGDDCIVIKSGLNEDGWRVNKPCKNIMVTDCFTAKGHGGVVIGSEMSGGVENVFVNNCEFIGTGRGIRIKTMKGRGGYIKNLHFQNLKMDSIEREMFVVNMNYEWSSIQPNDTTAPVISDIFVSNVSCRKAGTAIRLVGLEESKIRNVKFSNITVGADSEVELTNSENVDFAGVQINNKIIDYEL